MYSLSLLALSWAIFLFLPPISTTAQEHRPYYHYCELELDVFHQTFDQSFVPPRPTMEEDDLIPEIQEFEEDLPEETVYDDQDYDIVLVRMLVTACSPQDRIDVDYYARHGYEGSTYNVAADTSVLPRGTRIRIPGYMPVSFPGRWWSVDSAGGSIIRRATRRGIIQIDVKYWTEYSALRWGRQWLDVEVQIPRTEDGRRLMRRLRPHIIRVL